MCEKQLCTYNTDYSEHDLLCFGVRGWGPSWMFRSQPTNNMLAKCAQPASKVNSCIKYYSHNVLFLNAVSHTSQHEQKPPNRTVSIFCACITTTTTTLCCATKPLFCLTPCGENCKCILYILYLQIDIAWLHVLCAKFWLLICSLTSDYSAPAESFFFSRRVIRR